MLYKKYLILLLFINLTLKHLFSQDYFCKKNYYIHLVKFSLIEKDHQQEYTFLENGIPKFLFSFLRSKFFIKSELIPDLISNLNPYQKQCDKYILANLILNSDASINFDKNKNIKSQLKNQLLNLNADSILTGIIFIKDTIDIEFYYFNIYNNQFITKKISITKENPYHQENLLKFKEIADFFLSEITKNNIHKYYIKTSLKDYQVYVNDISYGKNLKDLSLPEGEFKISIYHDNCKQEYFSSHITNSMINFECLNISKKTLEIISSPENSEVYVDEKLVGKTPLKIELPLNIYRIRISKQGYIDKNIIINLKKETNKKLNITLREGNNEDYYYKKHYAISNWTYYDLSFGLTIQSLFFAGGWAYANIQKEKVLDSIRSPIIPNYYVNPLELSLIQYVIIEHARKKSLYWHRQSQIYGGLGILSLLSAGYFLYKGISIDLEKGYEIGNTNIKFQLSFQF
ncbi:MAG: hypothetical protein KatS3mg129_0091 [Leptospiraceae bacterium]|nr:MAG: hypothetical protein KatS3mg129_0091 [Leptospiraceae bacterium]